MARGLSSEVERRAAGWSIGPRNRWWLTGGVAAVVLAAGLTWCLVRPGAPGPRARPVDYTACLLTDQGGLDSPTAAPVWAAMDDASTSTHTRAQYQTPPNADDLAPYLTSMALSGCNVVFTVDTAAADATNRVAPGFTHVRFYVVGGTDHPPNVTLLHGTTYQIADQVHTAITDAS